MAESAWESVDAKDPRKALATEIWAGMRAGLPWTSRNGSPNRATHPPGPEVRQAKEEDD
jgi:hypothetical protein